MNKDQSFQVIEQGLNIASQKGAFTLQDSAALFNALQVVKDTHNKFDKLINDNDRNRKAWYSGELNNLKTWAVKEIWKLRDEDKPFSEEYAESFIEVLDKQIEESLNTENK